MTLGVIDLTKNREVLKQMIDDLPEDKLTKLHDILDEWLDDELTKTIFLK